MGIVKNEKRLPEAASIIYIFFQCLILVTNIPHQKAGCVCRNYATFIKVTDSGLTGDCEKRFILRCQALESKKRKLPDDLVANLRRNFRGFCWNSFLSDATLRHL